MDLLEMETKWQGLEILKSQSTQQNLNSPVFLENLNIEVNFVLFLMVLPEKEHTAPKPEEEAAQKKGIPEETEDTKTYGPGVNSALNKCW